MTPEAGDGADVALGRFVTITFRDAPRGLPFALAGEAPGSIRLDPLHARGQLPFVGERVHCRSTVGEWTTTVLSTSDGVLVLAAPRWLARAARRRGRRVTLDAPVTVDAAGEQWAGRLRDLSMKGAAVLVERGARVRPGDTVRIDVEGGTIQATVRSVRPHQRLLVVLGVSFDRLEATALRWVAATVTGRDGPPVTAPRD